MLTRSITRLLVLLAVVALLLSSAAPPATAQQQPPNIMAHYLIKRADQGSNIAVTYGIYSSREYPTVLVEGTAVMGGGEVTSIVADGNGGWRGTVSAVVERCYGRITMYAGTYAINKPFRTLLKEQCAYLPQLTKATATQ